MALDPLCLHGTSQFFVECSDDREVIIVVWLFCQSYVFSEDKGDSIDGDLAVYQPTKFTAVSESPVPSYEGD
jgi:hypothetical protein